MIETAEFLKYVIANRDEVNAALAMPAAPSPAAGEAIKALEQIANIDCNTTSSALAVLIARQTLQRILALGAALTPTKESSNG
jgi:hypothetical protein